MKIAKLVILLLSLLPVAPRSSGSDIPAELQKLSQSYLKSGSKSDRAELAEYSRRLSSPGMKALARFALGMGDYDAEKFASAAQELQQAAEGLKELSDYAVYFAASSLAQEEDFKKAAAVSTDFSRKFPESRLADDALRTQAESLIRAERRAEAKTLLENSKSQMSEPVRLFLLARIEHVENRRLQAVRAYRKVYYKYPFSDEADKAERHLNELRRILGKKYPEAPSKWRLERADALFGARRFSKAAREYRWASKGLQGKDRERALVRIGSSDYGRIHTTQAYRWLKPLKVKDADLDAERIYYLGQCARRLKRIKEFRARAEELGQKYPRSHWYEDALFSLGNYYLLENEPQQYRKYYERAARAFPKGRHSDRAHWKVCWRAYLERDPRARSLFQEHIRLYPQSASVSSAMYWLGRLEEKENPSLARTLYSEVVERFPHYYYGFLAKDQLEQVDEVRKASPAARPAYFRSLPPTRQLSEEVSEPTATIMRRGVLLYQLGLDELAAAELNTGDYRKPDAHILGLELAKQYAERGLYHRALRTMKRYGFGYLRLPLDSMPREFWEGLYPMPFDRQLRARVKPHGLDPYLIAGLIRQESEFNPSARSRAGARGLMQIMPATGKGLARRLRIKGFSTRHLYRPDTSLRLGTFHFRTVHDQFQRVEYTLAAYNAGEHRVEEWVTWEKFSEPAEFVESIPFTETRGYVQAVLRNAWMYRELYERPGKKTPSKQAQKAQGLSDSSD